MIYCQQPRHPTQIGIQKQGSYALAVYNDLSASLSIFLLCTVATPQAAVSTPVVVEVLSILLSLLYCPFHTVPLYCPFFTFPSILFLLYCPLSLLYCLKIHFYVKLYKFFLGAQREPAINIRLTFDRSDDDDLTEAFNTVAPTSVCT